MPSTTVFPAPRRRTTLRAVGFSIRLAEFLFMQDRQSLLNQAPAQISLGIYDVSKFLQVFLGRSTDDGVAILRPRFHFPDRGVEAGLDLFGRFGAALGQTSAEFVNVRRHEKNVGEGLTDEFVLMLTNVRRALNVDVDQNVATV